MAVALRAADEIVGRAEDAVGRYKSFTLAWRVGSTPKALYGLLVDDPTLRVGMPWDRTHFLFGDERHVPPDHIDSNYRVVRETMLSKAPVPGSNVHRIRTENPEGDVVANAYSTEIKAISDHLGRPGDFPQFDVVLLGVGSDWTRGFFVFQGLKLRTNRASLRSRTGYRN